jgi:hypothetical protein
MRYILGFALSVTLLVAGEDDNIKKVLNTQVQAGSSFTITPATDA